jgi:hypothetical protein
MFFRIYFLYLAKLWWVGFVLCIVGMLAHSWDWGEVVKLIGLALILPISILGALLAIPLLFFKWRLRCPVCGTPGEVVFTGRSPGLECVQCGMVSCKNPVTSFHITVEPLEDENSEPDEE